MAAGMLSGLFSSAQRDVRQESLDEESRLQKLADMDPFKAAAYTAYGSAARAGRGLGEAIASVAGADPRTPAKRNLDAVEAAKAEVAKLGFSPDDPKSIDEFYRRVMLILQKQGLALEAADIGREWHTQKNQDAKISLQNEELQRKKAKDAASDANAQARNRILEKKGALGAETIQLLAALDAVDPLAPEGEAKKKAILARLNALSAGKGVKFMNLGDRVAVVDAATGEELRSEAAGARPMSEKDAAKADDKDLAAENAYKEAKASLQAQYDAAVGLYNHPGVEGITGRTGRLVGESGVAGQTATTLAGADARGALNLWQQVTGSTFIAALGQLKAASPTGSTGLGAVSDAEGKKVQAAAAALGREQDASEFRQRLATYIQVLEGSSQRLDAAAQTHSIPPIPLQAKPLTGPAKGRRTPAAPPVAPTPTAAPAPSSAAPAAPAAPGREKWGYVNGKLQQVK